MEGLDKDDISRFSRQIILDEVGCEGQLKLKRAKILVVGAGGLGSTAIPYLCSAGVGTVGIVDHDEVEASNLQRQIIHSEKTVGEPKTASARSFAKRLNGKTTVHEHRVWLSHACALDIVRDYDLVLDCCDNVRTRYLLNDVCVALDVPLICGSALGWQGQLSVYNAGPGAACYRCLHPSPPPQAAVGSCADNGVIGAVPGVVSTS